MEVTLIDPEKNPGGVCLYRGCIPSKALLHVAKVVDEAEACQRAGASSSAEPKIDVNRVRAYKNRVIEKLTGGTGQVAKLRKVAYLQGRATIAHAKTPERAHGQRRRHGGASTTSILAHRIASRRRIPALSLERRGCSTRPARSTCRKCRRPCWSIGGGYIGLELGSVYAALGTRVSVVEMTPACCPAPIAIWCWLLAQRVEKTFDRVMLSTRVWAMKAAGEGGSRSRSRAKVRQRRRPSTTCWCRSAGGRTRSSRTR